MLVLIGFMGAGKTTVGRLVGQRLGVGFIDADSYLQEQAGRSVAEIFAEDGESYFRELEHEVVTGLVQGTSAVIALGGGAVEDRRTQRVLREVRVGYLRVGYDEAMSRVASDGGRPMLARADLDEIYRRRLPIYESLAALSIDTAGRDADAVALELLTHLGRAATGPEPGQPLQMGSPLTPLPAASVPVQVAGSADMAGPSNGSGC